MTRAVIYNPRGWISAHRLKVAVRDLGVECIIASEVEDATEDDFIVSWGFAHPAAKLNAEIRGNKLGELEKFRGAGVPTVNFARSAPHGATNWLGRKVKHRSGNDLRGLARGVRPDFYVERLTDVDLEFRVHVFKDKSIRTGMKRPAEEANGNHHPWIRSEDLGWMLDYGRVCQQYITDDVRKAAKDAVSALEYDFGAVDVGLRSGGRPVVFEVNSAPGLTWNTATVYAKHIVKAMRGEE